MRRTQARRKRWRVTLYAQTWAIEQAWQTEVPTSRDDVPLGQRDFRLWRNALRWARRHYDHDGIRVDAWRIGSRAAPHAALPKPPEGL